MELTLKVRDVEDMSKYFNFESLSKCTSDIVSAKELFPISKVCKFERSHRLLGRVPFNLFPYRDKEIKDDKFPRDEGIGPSKELYPSERPSKCLSCPKYSGICLVS